jgi:hypothetical protein
VASFGAESRDGLKSISSPCCSPTIYRCPGGNSP